MGPWKIATVRQAAAKITWLPVPQSRIVTLRLPKTRWLSAVNRSKYLGEADGRVRVGREAADVVAADHAVGDVPQADGVKSGVARRYAAESL
jgi:hypothetical protein